MDGVPSTGSTSAVADAHPARQVRGRLLIATLLVAVGFSVHAETAHAAFISLRVTFTNNSDSALTLTKAHLDHGCWTNEGEPGELAPPANIARGATVVFQSESCGVFTGTEFHVAYKLSNGPEISNGSELEMIYDIPALGENEYKEVTPSGYESKRSGDCSHCNHAELTVTFSCASTGCPVGPSGADGIPTEWKKNGVSISPKTGKPPVGVEEGEFINLPAMGVSLERPNVLIQMDWMQETEGKKRNQQLVQANIDRVIEAFNKDPATYSGATLPGITLIVDNGPESTITPGGKKWGVLSKATAIPWEATFLTGTREKVNSENFENFVKKDLVPTGRKPIFHYAVAVAKLLPAEAKPGEADCTSGYTPNAGTKEGFGFIVSLGGVRKLGEACWESGVGSANQQTGTFMHELGHALGLLHGGEDSINFKPNYPSVMNYLFQFPGVLRNGERVFDYSREPEKALEEKTLTEKGGMSSFGANPLKYGISWICATGAAEPPTKSTANLAEVDWNCDTPEKIEEGEGFIVNGKGGREAEGKEGEAEILRELKGTANSDWGRINFKTGGVGTGTAGENAAFPVIESTNEITPEVAARMRTQPHVSYTGALKGHYHDPVTASAKLVDPSTEDSPLVGASIAFKLGSSASDACTAITDSSGAASCTITPSQEAGTYNIVASFAGSSDYQPASDTRSFAISPEETTMSYTGPTVILAGASGATLSATLVEDGGSDNDGDGGSSAPVPSESVTLAIGTETCTGKTDASGNVNCTIPSVTTPLGPETVGAVFAGDGFYAESSANKTAIVFAFPSRGAFTLGDTTAASATATTTVTWWAGTWSSLNSLSGGLAPLAFKGFAGNITLPTTTPVAKCGSSWTTTGGNSPPPTTSAPSYMGAVVTSKVTKSGETVSGNTVKIVVVKTNPGYSPSPGHPGTGTIVATFC